MRPLLIFIISIILTACASSPQQSVTTYDTDGNPIRTTTNMSGSEYMDVSIAREKAKCQQAYNKRFNDGDISDARDYAIIAMAEALNPKDPCPTVATNNDVKIVKTQERHKTGRKALGITVPLLGIITAGDAIETLATTRDPVIVNQPEPIIVEPFVVTPEIVVLP